MSFATFVWLLTFYKLFLIGTVGLIGSDDLLACFIAGNSFTWDDWFRVETENAHLMEVNAPVLFCPLSNFFIQNTTGGG